MTADRSTPSEGQEADAPEQRPTTTPRDDSGQRTVGETADVWASVDTREVVDATALLVRGYWYDDEPGRVEVTARLGTVDVDVSLAPDQARALARQLGEAARYADERDHGAER